MRSLATLILLAACVHGGEQPAIPVADFSFAPHWGTLPRPAPVPRGREAEVGRIGPGDIFPIEHSTIVAVSDDGWWVALEGNVLLDLRRRAVFWRDGFRSPTFAGFSARHLQRADGVVDLDSGDFRPYTVNTGNAPEFVIADAGSSWGMPGPPIRSAMFPYLRLHRIANTQWSWLTWIPNAATASAGEPPPAAAWLVDHAGRRFLGGLSCQRSVDAIPTDNALLMARLSLGLAQHAQVPEAARRAMAGCGALRELTQRIETGRLRERRLDGDRLVEQAVPGAPGGLRGFAWSPGATAVCTVHDAVLQTWTADWTPIARMPLVRRLTDILQAGDGRILVRGDAHVEVDCRTLTGRPGAAPASAPGNGRPRPFVSASPQGITVLLGQRHVPVAPAELDWRQVRWGWQSDDLSLAVVLAADGRAWLTRLPDGKPEAINGTLPPPPFAYAPSPDGAELLAIAKKHLIRIRLADLTVSPPVQITGETTYAGTFFHGVPAQMVGGTSNGKPFSRLHEAFHWPAFRPGPAWPLVLNQHGTHTLDLSTGRIAPYDTASILARVRDLDGWEVRRLIGDPQPDGRLVVELEQRGSRIRSTAVVDPTGAQPSDIAPVDAQSQGSPFHLGSRVYVDRAKIGTLVIWNAATGGWARISPQPDGSVVAWSDDGYIAVPRRHADTLSIGVGRLGVRGSAFDLQINRPDKVLERIGLADPGYIALLRDAWQRRVRRLGLDPALVVKPERYQHLPRLRLTDVPPGRTGAARIELACEVRTRTSIALTISVRIGGLAVGAIAVPSSGDVGTPTRLRVPVDLHVGINRIELVPVLADGSSGVPAMAIVRRDGPPPRTRLAAIGVSAYREPGRDLGFAAADARGLAETLAGAGDRLVLTDAAVVRAAVAQVRDHLAAAESGDLAVISVAAHGLVDAAGAYYIATHDADFASPRERGIAIGELLDTLRASPARRRLLLLDTCHAGVLEDAPPPSLAAALPDGRARGLRPAAPATPPGSPPPGPIPAQQQAERPERAAAIARTMFLDAGWDDGITVLAACHGDEASWESPAWGHGAFTRAIIRALGVPGAQADRDGDGAIDLDELGTFVMAEVPRMTGGLQNPEIRSGELDRDIVLRRADP